MIRRLILAALVALAPSLASAQVNSQSFSVAAYVKYVLSGNIVIGGNLTVGGSIIDNTNGISLNSPTGGLKGAGTINLAGDYYKNGTIIPETVSAPLSLSALGVVSCPTCVLISGTAHGDSAYAILSTDRYVYTNAAFTLPRIWTLPAANSLAAGTTIWVQDAQNTVTSTNTLTISRAGADTIDVANTTLVITGAGGGITFTTDGVSNWGTPIQTVTTGGTGQKTLTNHGVLIGAAANPVTQLAVGATGTVLTGATGADPIFNSTVTLTPTAASIAQGFNITQSGPTSGNQNAQINFNSINITSDQANTGSSTNTATALSIQNTFGGSNAAGARGGLFAQVTMVSPTSATNPSRNYTGIVGTATCSGSGDGGTGLTVGTAKGSCFGGNFVAQATGANLLAVNGQENDVGISSPGSAMFRWAFSAVSTGNTQGAVSDAAYHVGSLGALAFKNALNITDENGAAPLSTTGCVICSDGVAHTIATGIDLSSYTISGNIFNFGASFSMTGAGSARFGGNGHYSVVGGTGSGFWLDSVTTGADRFFFGSDASVADSFRIFSVLAATNIFSLTSNASPASAQMITSGSFAAGGAILSSGTGGVGYSAGAGGAVTQITSRVTGVTLNKVSGAITLVSAAGSATPAQFTVTNSVVAATDTISISQKSGTDKYNLSITAVAAGSFQVNFFTTGGTTTEQPVFSFNVIKGVAS